MIKIDISLTGTKHSFYEEMSIKTAKTFLSDLEAKQDEEPQTAATHISLDIYEAMEKWRHVNITSVYPEILLDLLNALETKENLS